MNTDEILTRKVSPWEPITHQHTLAVLGKLGEEANELGAKLFRAVIQGLDEKNPDTGVVNRKEIEDEIADVFAMAEIARMELGLDAKAMELRIARKLVFKKPWFDYLRGKR